MGVLYRHLCNGSYLKKWCVDSPKNPIGGVLVAGLLGIIFRSVSALIPVVRRLMHKGMPAYIAVTFILSGPVVNPIVFTATLLAFPSLPKLRLHVWACICSSSFCWWFSVYFVRTNPLRTPKAAITDVKTHPGFKMDNHTHTHTEVLTTTIMLKIGVASSFMLETNSWI
ncbi:permease [Paenibacillus sp. DCT19]|uniref:permease n=1 Tax=Paenibacillus sp. DCT19 TaxID=2211212 RepID=UPI0020C2FBDC|nr:permease [Paenibacillus sp. DCT19]